MLDSEIRLALDDLNDLSRNLADPSDHDNRYYVTPKDVPLDVIRNKINSATQHILNAVKENNLSYGK